MNLGIVIPVNNEELNIVSILLRLRETLNGNYEIVVVDDYSTDRTSIIIKEMIKDFLQLRLLRNPYKKGFANALKAGINMAQGDVVITVMGDLCDDIKIIPQMYQKILEGYDIVCASRYMKGGERQGGSILKAFLSRYVCRLIHTFSRIPTTDLTNSFRAYRKTVFKDIIIESKGFEIAIELLLKAYLRGYRITDIPTKWRERTNGQSHFGIFRDGIKFMKWFLLYFCSPFRFKLI